MVTGWLSQRRADVPAGDAWLGAAELAVHAELTFDKRRADWRLGRWTAKRALAVWLGVPPARVQVLAGFDGAPEAWLDGGRLDVSISLSHRGDRAIAAVSARPAVAGCDLELLEPRSDPFVREWLAPQEQAVLYESDPAARILLANLFWSAKEATAKVWRAGLNLNVRRAQVTLTGDGPGVVQGACGVWQPLCVDWLDGARPSTSGWWRADDGWVIVIAGHPAPAMPDDLSARPVLAVLGDRPVPEWQFDEHTVGGGRHAVRPLAALDPS
jgi:4'-phosphopantetheinyl transferase